MAALAVAAALSLLCAAASSKVAFNLYLKQHESRRLFGLDVELFYVKEGRRNEYALGFVVPVPANVSELEFVWQALGTLPLAYALDVQVNEGRGHRALGSPTLDVPPRGTLPVAPRSFRVRLPCTGLASAEVPVLIVLNVSAPDTTLYDLSSSAYGVTKANATSVSLPRNKICARDAQALSDEGGGSWRAGLVPSPVASSSSSSRSLVVVAGCACAALAAVALTAAVAWLVRVRKASPSAAAPGEEEAPTWQAWSSSGRPLSCGPPWMLEPTTSDRGEPGSRETPESPALRTSAGCASGGALDGAQSDLTERLTEIHVDRRKVTFLENLHQGTFGQIFHGLLVEDWAEVGAEQNVLIKTVTGEASAAQASLAVREGLSLLGMNHANVLSVVGAACDEPGPPLLIYPYMNAGNLKRFLRQSDQVLVTQDLVDIAIQVAEGLQYLHKRGFVHRDVGTRNCVVDDRLHVKVTDSALSRDLFPDDYHCLGDGENRPVKWLAPESLGPPCLFSAASDLWMFGVTLWELMTLAQQPYAELDPFEVAEHLERGYRLAQPVNCPDPLYLVMDSCWRAEPEQRPTSAALLRHLADLYAALGRFI